MTAVRDFPLPHDSGRAGLKPRPRQVPRARCRGRARTGPGVYGIDEDLGRLGVRARAPRLVHSRRASKRDSTQKPVTRAAAHREPVREVRRLRPLPAFSRCGTAACAQRYAALRLHVNDPVPRIFVGGLDGPPKGQDANALDVRVRRPTNAAGSSATQPAGPARLLRQVRLDQECPPARGTDGRRGLFGFHGGSVLQRRRHAAAREVGGDRGADAPAARYQCCPVAEFHTMAA